MSVLKPISERPPKMKTVKSKPSLGELLLILRKEKEKEDQLKIKLDKTQSDIMSPLTAGSRTVKSKKSNTNNIFSGLQRGFMYNQGRQDPNMPKQVSLRMPTPK
jgi:hypothetical protein